LQDWKNPLTEWNHIGEIKIDSVSVDSNSKNLWFKFSNPLSYIPTRENTIELISNSVDKVLRKRFSKYEHQIFVGDKPLNSLIPNYYRSSIPIDSLRFAPSTERQIPVVRRLNHEVPSNGLYNRHIALWNSHGRYYETKLDRWEWQRARLFTTVEDLLPTSFVLPYLVPMLENAGANVFLPRERDTQSYEVIVDNDRSSEKSIVSMVEVDPQAIEGGFLMKPFLISGEHPFEQGSHLKLKAKTEGTGYIQYIPYIPSAGKYAVYVSYQQNAANVSDAKYTVVHSGGSSDFYLNQKMGGGTWIYLGTFYFKEGSHSQLGAVRLSNESAEDGWITSDAVKFGGGIGNVARRPNNSDSTYAKAKVSGKPRYQEAARYYLQYAGFPDSLVYDLNQGTNDYNDDYQSRGEWVNYLMGAPNGPSDNPEAEGLNIPIDLSFAFHTDAGITSADSTIGTLAIYSTFNDSFPNGHSKMLSRDLTDIIQTEIVHDIRSIYNENWTRRAMWDKQYSEAWRPNVPAMLLELLSHQNLSEMRYALEPGFRFDVSRSIYKGIAKYFAFQDDYDCVIQPLPVDHFKMEKIGPKKIRLTWEMVIDSLEQSATAKRYKVYQRIGDNGFDNGFIAEQNSVEIKIQEFGQIYSYKVTALNDGGESFPSEILSVCLQDKFQKPILIVNAFDRIDAPAIIEKGDFAGVAFWEDEGVPDKFEIGYTGRQYDFDRSSHWLDDDSPGWGASYGDMEGKLIPGNSFDNTLAHGKAIAEAGYSYLSCSDEAFINLEIADFDIIDFIVGEEKTTYSATGSKFQVFNQDMINKITEFTQLGGNVLISGAYIGTDHIHQQDTVAATFARDILHFKWRTNHAVKTGDIYTTDHVNATFAGRWKFNTEYHPTVYKVEAPDAIEPVGEGAMTVLRYTENNASAGVLFNGAYKALVLGFPLETIVDQKERFDFMKQILDLLE